MWIRFCWIFRSFGEISNIYSSIIDTIGDDGDGDCDDDDGLMSCVQMCERLHSRYAIRPNAFYIVRLYYMIPCFWVKVNMCYVLIYRIWTYA